MIDRGENTPSRPPVPDGVSVNRDLGADPPLARTTGEPSYQGALSPADEGPQFVVPDIKPRGVYDLSARLADEVSSLDPGPEFVRTVEVGEVPPIGALTLGDPRTQLERLTPEETAAAIAGEIVPREAEGGIGHYVVRPVVISAVEPERVQELSRLVGTAMSEPYPEGSSEGADASGSHGEPSPTETPSSADQPATETESEQTPSPVPITRDAALASLAPNDPAMRERWAERFPNASTLREYLVGMDMPISEGLRRGEIDIVDPPEPEPTADDLGLDDGTVETVERELWLEPNDLGQTIAQALVDQAEAARQSLTWDAAGLVVGMRQLVTNEAVNEVLRDAVRDKLTEWGIPLED